MRIRRLVEDIDEQHREAMRTIEDDLGELHFGTADPRGPGLASAVRAQPRPRRRRGRGCRRGTDRRAGIDGGRTVSSSSAEEELPASDLVIVEFAVGLELAAESAYVVAVATKLFDSEQDELARTFGRHHHEHAVALATLAGRDADTVGFPNPKIVEAR